MSVRRCTCGHHEPFHGRDRKGRPTCFGSTVCACREFREPSPDPAADHWRRVPEHLRTDDIQSYLRQKGEIA